MINTFVKLFREFEHWGWYKNGNTKDVFIHCLIRAVYVETMFEGILLKPGQIIYGRKKWARDLGMSEQNVRTAINHLITTGEITKVSTGKFSIITVVNWEKWQVQNGDPNQQTDQNTGRRSTTSKEGKKGLPSLDITPETASEFEELWSDYPRKQGSKKKAFMAYATARNAGTTYEDVKAGLEAYNTYIRINETPLKYIAYGSTWFEENRWNNVYQMDTKHKGDKNHESNDSTAGNEYVVSGHGLKTAEY